MINTVFDIICVQETWLTNRINSAEITKNTNFLIYRRDRSEFTNTRKRGGGLAMIIRNTIPFTELKMMQSMVEIQGIRINAGDKFTILLNVYVPNYGCEDRRSMFRELAIIMEGIFAKYPGDNIIMTVDFNLARIKWTYTEDEPGYLVPVPAMFPYNTYELLALNMWSKYELKQICYLPNSYGAFLDLCLVTNINVANVFEIHDDDKLDKDSTSHKPIGIRLLSGGSIANNRGTRTT